MEYGTLIEENKIIVVTNNSIYVVGRCNATTGETLDEFFVADATNIGTGKAGEEVDIKLVDESDLEPYFIKMEIQAG